MARHHAFFDNTEWIPSSTPTPTECGDLNYQDDATIYFGETQFILDDGAQQRVDELRAEMDEMCSKHDANDQDMANPTIQQDGYELQYSTTNTFEGAPEDYFAGGQCFYPGTLSQAYFYPYSAEYFLF